MSRVNGKKPPEFKLPGSHSSSQAKERVGVKHLRYDCMGASYAGENRHPQEVMREYGITYERAIPQSMGDQWWLFNCDHGDLPGFITEMKCDDWMAKQYHLPEAYKNA